MDPERALLTRIAATGKHLDELLAAGVTADHFDQEMHKGLWAFLVQHTDEFGRQPSTALVLERFEDWNREESEQPFKYLKSRFYQGIARREVLELTEELTHAAYDPKQAGKLLELLEVKLERIAGLVAGGQDGAGAASLEVVPLDEFADTAEEGAEAIVGDEDNIIIPEGGNAMLYGTGGAGKTTLANELAFCIAAGDEWLGVPVPRPRRVLLVENEGPRPLFRKKLLEKRDGWKGSPVDDRVQVYAEPWARFTFSSRSSARRSPGRLRRWRWTC